MGDNLPLQADYATARRIGLFLHGCLDKLYASLVRTERQLDRSVLEFETAQHLRRWLAMHSGKWPGPYRPGDVQDMDSGSLQTLAIEIDRELEGRGYQINRSVSPPCVPMPVDDEEWFAEGTEP